MKEALKKLPDKVDKTFEYKLNNNKKVRIIDKSYLNTKNLVNISVFTAASVSLIILLVSYTPILAVPTFRIAFEGLFVKLVGYIFGPFVGIIVGLITEVLINFFRPSYIHWAFFLTMILYGFCGGIGFWINKRCPDVKKKIYVLFILFLILLLAVVCLYIIAITVPYFQDHLISDQIRITYRSYLIIISGFCFLYILSLVFFVFYHIYRKNWEFLSEITTIIIFTVIIDFGITNLIIPIADADITNIGYSGLVFVKLLFSPFISYFNIAIIYTAVYVLKKIIYEKK
ncbi:ECF transporter S component [symbiont of Argiope bruennichi]|uniref:ECF transporter S component n=1 Tax=symbiont of Argiope bruennichi TaxID=2810479 RepID=UPI003DA4F944